MAQPRAVFDAEASSVDRILLAGRQVLRPVGYGICERLAEAVDERKFAQYYTIDEVLD